MNTPTFLVHFTLSPIERPEYLSNFSGARARLRGTDFLLTESDRWYLDRTAYRANRNTPPEAIVAVGGAGMGRWVVHGGAKVLRTLLTTSHMVFTQFSHCCRLHLGAGRQ
jgi:hypothetical protein